MTSLPLRGYIIITISFLLAILLSIFPLPDWLAVFRPPWVALVLVYWAIALPSRIGLGIAWASGLLLDGLNDTVLGEHALALVVVAYLAHKSYLQIRMFPLSQQALSIMVFILIYQILLLLIQSILGQLTNSHWFWAPAVTSLLVWPMLFILLRGCRRQFSIN